MTALADARTCKPRVFSEIELPATPSDTYYQGALVGWNTSTNLLVVGQALTTFQPVGIVAETKTLGSGGGTILVTLPREIKAFWFANSASGDEITAVGGLAYVVDDQTVAKTDNTNARSVAGRVWAVSATRGVLVELTTEPGRTLSGLDV